MEGSGITILGNPPKTTWLPSDLLGVLALARRCWLLALRTARDNPVWLVAEQRPVLIRAEALLAGLPGEIGPACVRALDQEDGGARDAGRADGDDRADPAPRIPRRHGRAGSRRADDERGCGMNGTARHARP